MEGETQEDAFSPFKKLMVEAPVLEYPNASKVYALDTDASTDVAGVVLSRCLGGQELVVTYYSTNF